MSNNKENKQTNLISGFMYWLETETREKEQPIEPNSLQHNGGIICTWCSYILTASAAAVHTLCTGVQ